MNNDNRLYTDIQLEGHSFVALLDSGATISCLGGKAAAQLKSHPNVQKSSGRIKTANNSECVVIGRLVCDITYRGITKPVEFYIIPTLKQDAYLGIDFWRDFGLLNQIVQTSSQVNELDVGRDVDVDEGPPKVHSLSEHQRIELEQVKLKLPSFEKEGLGRTKVIEHSIDVGDAKAIKQRHWPISPAKEKLMFSEIQNMLDLDVIEESKSAWSSNCVLVRKGEKIRLCLDSREINKCTRKDAYPLPHVDGILSRLPPARFITGLDMKHAFWQIPLEEKSRQITAFTIPNRPLYQYKVMPFGLCNAAQTLVRLMDQVIPAHLRTRVFVYLDDLLVLSEDFESHMVLLSEIAGYLRNANLTINIAKSKFCMQEIKYLGFIIGHGKIKTDPGKLTAINEFPIPTTVKQLRRFLGMTGWYRRFVDGYASVTLPLTELLKKNKQFKWNPQAQGAFEMLKGKLSSAPILITPDFSKPFLLLCDASLHGLGCVLAQLSVDGSELPIAYMSVKLTKQQRNYTVTELECLAVLKGIQKFRSYIEGQAFVVITDHASLKWLLNQKDLTGRLARWALQLRGLECTIQHRKGSHNVVADALSRRDENEVSEFADSGPIIDLKSKEFESPEYLDLLKNVIQNQSKLPDLKISDNFLYKRTEFASGEEKQEVESWKLWIPNALINDVLHRAHDPPDSAHCGTARLIAKLKRYLFWPGMVTQIRNFVANCSICKSTKSANMILRPPMGKPMSSDRPFQKLYLDILGPYPRSKSGNIGLLIVVDHNTKFHFLQPLKKFTSSKICEFLENVFYTFGVPETVLTDNGSQFKSGCFKAFLTQFGVSQICTAIYSPQANASERLNRSVLAAIRAYIGKEHINWDVNLNEINASIRANIHRSTGHSPYYLCFGQNMMLNGQDYELLRKLNMLSDDTTLKRPDMMQLARAKAKVNIDLTHDVNARRYNLRSRSLRLKVGDTVYARNFAQSNAAKNFSSKLAPVFVKASVAKQLSPAYYELQNEAGKKLGVYHLKDIKV